MLVVPNTLNPGSVQDQLRVQGSLGGAVPRGLTAGLPRKGDSAFARPRGPPAKKPRFLGCTPQLPSAGVSAFATYAVRGASALKPDALGCESPKALCKLRHS